MFSAMRSGSPAGKSLSKSFVFVALLAVVSGAKDLPVFPGAVGFGTATPAGRGGKVIAVTSLADSGKGSLREAVEQEGPRIVVFRVGGVISLKSQLVVKHPFLTIAGQTAPGDGILIRDIGIVIGANDVLIQHLRIRPGNRGDIRPDHNDALQVFGKTGDLPGAYNVVVDHVSVGWGEDELISTWFAPRDVTFSWCLIGEALSRSRHGKGEHSAGLLVGGGATRVSAHHNLLAHNDFRNPLFISGGTHEFVANVVYDWGALPTEIVDDAPETNLNIIGNDYIPGPSTKQPCEILMNPRAANKPQLYVADNIGPRRLFDRQPGWDSVCIKFKGVDAPTDYRADAPFDTPAAKAFSGQKRPYDTVLSGAGATAPRRDRVDVRLVQSVKALKGNIIDDPEQVGGYPVYMGQNAPPDGDGDGMPDAWEAAQGLNPREPGDAAQDADGDGYTNIEEYLHALSAGEAPR